MRRVLRGLAAAAVATAAMTLLEVPIAGAAAPDQTGWWSTAQPASGALPNATANPGELEVAGSPAGPVAFAAVLYKVPSEQDGQSVDPTQASGTLILSIAPNSSTQGASLQVCPITSQWKAEENGAMTDAPKYTCPATPVAGQVSPDGNTVTFTLASSLMTQPGQFDLAVLPSGPAPFLVKFAKPDQGSMGVSAPPAAGGPTSGDTGASTPPEATTPLTPATALAGPTLPPSGAGLSASIPTDTPLAAAPPPAPAAPAPASPSLGLRRAGHASGWTKERQQQVMSVGLLMAIAAALWWMGGAAQRAPRLLGSLGGRKPEAQAAAVRVGGVGRFARPRTAAPRPI